MRLPRPLFRRRLIVLLTALSVCPCLAYAQPTAGFVENWPGTSLEGWGGGATYSNPGTGGVGGAGDGFLMVNRPLIGNLGTTSQGTEYVGNWTAAGIVAVKLWLKDVGGNQALEIHFAIGNGGNFWQYNLGFLPPEANWQEFTVDLTSAA